MDHDALSFSIILVSLTLLFVATHPVWLFTLALGGLYAGWRIGQRLIPAETNGV